MKPKFTTVVYMGCPACGHERAFNVSDRTIELGQPFGPWMCPECGVAVEGTWAGEDTEVEINRELAWHPLLQLIVIPEPIAVVTSSIWPTNDIANLRLAVEEESCPVNSLNQFIHAVIAHDEGTNLQGLPLDSDPHGLLKLAAISPYTAQQRLDLNFMMNISAAEIDDLFTGQLAEHLT